VEKGHKDQGLRIVTPEDLTGDPTDRNNKDLFLRFQGGRDHPKEGHHQQYGPERNDKGTCPELKTLMGTFTLPPGYITRQGLGRLGRYCRYISYRLQDPLLQLKRIIVLFLQAAFIVDPIR
jgi:hypothetical protein